MKNKSLTKKLNKSKRLNKKKLKIKMSRLKIKKKILL